MIIAISAACLTGVLLFLSHPPLALWFAAWVALVPLLLVLPRLKSWKTALLVGWIGGLVYYALSLSWIENVVQEYSALPWPVPLLGVLILAAVMALYLGAFAALAHFGLSRKSEMLLVWLPAVWVVLERLQAELLTGFPWNLLGYSQLHFLPMAQVADIGGVYMVGFVVTGINMLIYSLIQHRKNCRQVLKKPAFLIMTAIFVFTLVYGVVQLNIDYSSDDRFTATVIQDDLDNTGRWEIRRQDPFALYRYYEEQTLKAVQAGSQVVLWGEGAFMYLDMMRENGAPPWRSSDFEELSIFSLVRDNNFWLVMGSNDYINNGANAFNTAVSIGPEHQGSVTGRYAKIHLTPFGEYIPYSALLGWLDKIVPEISDFGSGESANPIPLLDGMIGVPICYEVIFPDLVRTFVNQGATVLATISNDAWFGRSAANQQHFEMAAFRAIENRRYLMRCAVSGISGFVDPHGVILQQSQTYQKASLSQEVAMLNGKTIYAAIGDIFVLLCLVVVVLFFCNMRQDKNLMNQEDHSER